MKGYERKKTFKLIFFMTHFSVQVFIFVQLIQNFTLTCENKDYLTWDPELRYVYSLELLNSLRRFECIEFIKLILDTPTWPPLRNLLHLVLFGFFGENPLLDVYLSLGELFLLDSFLTYIAWKFGKRLWEKWTNFLVTKSLYLSPSLLLYSFSGMLEIQGSLFLTLSTFLFCLSFGIRKKSYLRPIYGLSFLGLYFTKYPYGYMFLVSCGTLLFFYEYKDFLNLLERWKKIPISSHLFLILAFLFLVIYLLIPEDYLTGKLPRYFKFTIGLFSFLEIFLFFIKERKIIQQLYPKIFSFFIWTVFPVGIWTFIHPDRFGSSSSTIQHVQVEGHPIGEFVSKDWSYYSFFLKVVYQEIWLKDELGVLFGLFCLVVLLKKMKSFQKRRISFSFWILTTMLMQIFQVTFLTSNHQARHVYHLLPLILLSLVFALREISSKKIKLILFVVSLIVWLYFSKDFLNQLKTTNLCFSGRGEFYKPIDELKPYLELLIEKDVYLINQIEEGHLHRMNVEYIISRIAYKKGVKYHRQMPINKSFMILLVNRDCNDNSIILKAQLLAQIQTEKFCIKKFLPYKL